MLKKYFIHSLYFLESVRFKKAKRQHNLHYRIDFPTNSNKTNEINNKEYVFSKLNSKYLGESVHV
jgi:hypothetical protein